MKEDRKLAVASGGAAGISALASFIGLCCIGPWAVGRGLIGSSSDMKQSDSLALLEQGTLARPGPYGRLLRLALGILCSYALYELFKHGRFIIQSPVTVIPNIAMLVIPAVLMVNYVVNIGFGRSWGRWPCYVSVLAWLMTVAVSWLTTGTPDHVLPGIALWIWLVYFYAHLGISFLLAAIIATPGCEMRAIPELAGKLTGRPVAEHRCPAAILTQIDKWEPRRRRRPQVPR
jgi:hypothetical protein